MFSTAKLALLCGSALLQAVAAQTATTSSPLTSYTLTADNITAVYIPYGARLTHLLVPDRDGVFQDVVTGYDNVSQYPVDTATNHTYFGPVVGRYANRIKNGTFTVDGVTSQIPENENSGHDTLHGGTVGYDARNWTVVSYTNTSITFSLLDEAFEGFPGTVLTYATMTLSNTIDGSPWGISHPRITMQTTTFALDQPGPIMLANHIYWNLNAWKEPTLLNDTLWMPYARRYIGIDNIEVPNGTISTVASHPVLDFTAPKEIGADIEGAVDYCGLGCTGYDNAFIIDRPKDTGATASNFPVLSLWSDTTGIRLDIATNQQGLQIYSCNGQNGTIPVKPSQIARNVNATDGGAKFVNKYGCLVIETQGWIDAVNNPQWGLTDYWYTAPNTQPNTMFATYDFSTF
ncbi:aldose 1-epimerase [Coniella lustricola]|uniref:Aldose 1-epimerase n=1 Tax=Coniella lustricola TaxID=2025994 RepID=A0A2T3AJA6_9PEZI|nr:aldose 1-epimerase [Coniella lustricola]